MTGAEPLGTGFSYPVHGTLKHLPKDHKIWVLVQDEATGRLWPQGFSPVKFDPRAGTWTGKVTGSGRKDIRIFAVVAPPSSQDFFMYYQNVGGLRENKFEPLQRVPPECVNFDSVQARLP